MDPAPPVGWEWTAPQEKGLYPLRIIDRMLGDTILLNAFVMVPYDRDGVVNGYRIGRYEQPGPAGPAAGIPRRRRAWSR